jgi:hypothetical protein
MEGMSHMNENKIDFIVAYNNERLFEECMFYINKLIVPEGWEISVLGITEGKSLTGAYNEGMQASPAKYKVYLHQDVVILNRNFLSDIIAPFRSDASVGMMGVIGGVDLPKHGYFAPCWNVGRVYCYLVACILEIDNQVSPPYTEVEAIDGLMMITQYDLPWREDLFKGWDFYDASQSFEFRKAGYKVVVPYQEAAWCLHDSGYTEYHNYEESRLIFVENYLADYDEEGLDECPKNDPERRMMLASLKENISKLYAFRKFPEIAQFLRELQDTQNDDYFLLHDKDTELQVMCYVFEIYDQEMSEQMRDYPLFPEGFPDWQSAYKAYNEIKYQARRIEQGHTSEEEAGWLIRLVREGQISKWALYAVAKRATLNWQKVLDFFELSYEE